MSRSELAARLGRLRPRDTDCVRALIENPSLSEGEVAEKLAIGLNNLKARVQHAYGVLDVASRLELFAVYHTFFLVCCSE